MLDPEPPFPLYSIDHDQSRKRNGEREVDRNHFSRDGSERKTPHQVPGHDSGAEDHAEEERPCGLLGGIERLRPGQQKGGDC